ncbi:MAG: PaaI family thioesterase [Acidimicrobiales bacterium]|nr:PaaI family thioesterase [Acidimicrobiales bacterium]
MPDPEVTDEQIVETLRGIGRSIHAREPDADACAAIAGHLAAVQALLDDGEPRRRWYEMPPEDRDNRRFYRQLSTFSGRLNTIAPPIVITSGSMPDGAPALIGAVRLDRRYEGPPRAVHGGILAGLFDELLGGGQRLTGGPPGMTGRLTVRYRRPTPLDTDLQFRAWIADERERRVTVKADCRVLTHGARDGEADDAAPPTAEAEAIFLRVDYDGLERVLREREDGAAPAPAPRVEPS